jgi:hypothetical protein
MFHNVKKREAVHLTATTYLPLSSIRGCQMHSRQLELGNKLSCNKIIKIDKFPNAGNSIESRKRLTSTNNIRSFVRESSRQWNGWPAKLL